MRAMRFIPLLLVALLLPWGVGAAAPEEPPADHAVIVQFQYGSKDLQPLFQVEDELRAAIKKAKVGELDGHETTPDGRGGFIYMHGPDADRLLEVVEPILESTAFMKGAKITRRYGPAKGGVKQTTTFIAR